MIARIERCWRCGALFPWCQCSPAASTFADSFGQAHAAYLAGIALGDSDAYLALPADWSRHPAATLADGFGIDRMQGYADGYEQETARRVSEGRP